MNPRVPIAYTFGNHMHWVDMQWLWGYHVLPGSVRDMLDFCQAAGVRGNVNFDAVGYEKLAAEAPEVFADLRAAVKHGVIEIVGGSYGQPYGGIHGAESAIRHRVFGTRTINRLFGVRPQTFWEEEFDFYPQLPQILAQCGFKGAALFFQWTWHTPELPYESVPIVWWQGHDGTKLRAATRNRLNLHQWPEEAEVLLDQLAQLEDPDPEPLPMVLQWLELMPSNDWMCRSELILPKAKEFLNDPRFEVTRCTLGQYLEMAPATDEVRQYNPDQVFHGLTLGKNGDGFRRLSRWAERSLLTAETLATLAGRHGRPYAQWDVYPTWEIEEGWRELLIAQHHDNDECEGLCGSIGEASYRKSLALSQAIIDRTTVTLASRIQAESGQMVAFNPLGWPVTATTVHPVTGQELILHDVPALGWKVFDLEDSIRTRDEWRLTDFGATGQRGDLAVSIDRKGHITSLVGPGWQDGVLRDVPLLSFWGIEQGEEVHYRVESIEIDGQSGRLVIRFQHPVKGGIRVDLRLSDEVGGLDISITGGSLHRPDPGLTSGLRTQFALGGGIDRIVTDSPYAFHEVQATGTFRKKYPTGDWMTSPQWFEVVDRPFHALSSVDLLQGERGLLIVHDGSQQWFRTDRGVECILNCYDPWDEDYWINRFRARFRLVPHGAMSNRERHIAANTFLRQLPMALKESAGGDLPAEWSLMPASQGPAIVTAVYRETRDRGDNFEEYAANRFAEDYPTFIRLVEFDGAAGHQAITLTASLDSAARTNLLGETADASLVTTECADGTILETSIRPYDIATVAMDMVEARKRPRDLDAHRKVWATVHRVDS